jgi:heme-degrading monooxygenase HmoA
LARVIVWEDRAAFEAFERGAWRTREHALTSESCTFVLAPSRWHGRWGGRDPFAGAEPAEAAGTVAVLTRGTIRARSLRSFWRAVPGSQANLPGAAGLIASVAVGETPLVQSATFSVWRDVESVRAFAYGAGGGHLDVVRRTRSEGWYGEEMFARFAVLERPRLVGRARRVFLAVGRPGWGSAGWRSARRSFSWRADRARG